MGDAALPKAIPFRVVSWNINSLRAVCRLKLARSALQLPPPFEPTPLLSSVTLLPKENQEH